MEQITAKREASKWLDSLENKEYQKVCKRDELVNGGLNKERIWYKNVVKPWWEGKGKLDGLTFLCMCENAGIDPIPTRLNEEQIKRLYLMEQQAVSNVPLVEKVETWEEAQERKAYQSADMEDFENSTGSYSDSDTVDSAMENAAIKFRSQTDFLCEKSHSFNRDIEFSFEQGANYQKEKDKAIIEELIVKLESVIYAAVQYGVHSDHLVFNQAKELVKTAKQQIK